MIKHLNYRIEDAKERIRLTGDTDGHIGNILRTLQETLAWAKVFAELDAMTEDNLGDDLASWAHEHDCR